MAAPAKNDDPFDFFQLDKTLTEHGYAIQNRLGRGGYASVYLVKSVKYGCDFVAKVTRQKGDVPIEKENEIRTLISLTHPNIISIYEYFADESYLYLILEYCSQGSLADLVHNHGPLHGEQLVSVCRKITEGLIACHDARIAHRDIKPANILLDQYGRPKLSDFGLSDFFDKGSLLKSRAGSMAFLAPEVWTRAAGHDPFKADVWALGVTFYYLATGHLPWKTDSIHSMQQSIQMGIVLYDHTVFSRKFVELLKGMIQVDTNARMFLSDVLTSPALQEVTEEMAPSMFSRKLRRGQSRTLGMRSMSQGMKDPSLPGFQPQGVRPALSSDNKRLKLANFKAFNSALSGSTTALFAKRRNSILCMLK